MSLAASFCDCQPFSESDESAVCALPRRQLLGMALMGGLGACALPAVACTPEVVQETFKVIAPHDVCMECLVRRAQQRSAFVNKEQL